MLTFTTAVNINKSIQLGIAVNELNINFSVTCCVRKFTTMIFTISTSRNNQPKFMMKK